MGKRLGRFRDPRYYQIATLGALMAYGVSTLDFELSPSRIAILLVACLATQLACTRWFALPRFDPKSALISGLSLCLLLRTNSVALAVLTAIVTIGSKFVLRVDDRHLFNPTNFGLVVMMLLTGEVWVSPGQWGSGALLFFFIASVGGLVVYRAARSDVTYAFVFFYTGLLFSRAAWLGDPLAIPLHQLQSGSFLLFAFFMLSDPKTTPDSRSGRMLFAAMVAAGGAYVQFVMFQPHGLLYSLVAVAALTPVINRLAPGRRYRWQAETPPLFPEPIPLQRTATLLRRGSRSVARSYA